MVTKLDGLLSILIWEQEKIKWKRNIAFKNNLQVRD